VLEAEPDFAVVGEVTDGLTVPPLVAHLKPRVLVTDLMMPGIGGIEVTKQVHRQTPETRVVILSMHVAESFVVEALKSGAAAFVTKDAAGSELVRAVREAAAGRRYLSPPLSETLIDAFLEGRERPSDPLEALTEREREVLHLGAQGLTSKEIARRLDLSPRTAESHRANLMHKLGLKTQTDLIRFALQHGVIPPGSQ
jgi:DNA-binding NarL/FixJ family response regulator